MEITPVFGDDAVYVIVQLALVSFGDRHLTALGRKDYMMKGTGLAHNFITVKFAPSGDEWGGLVTDPRAYAPEVNISATPSGSYLA